MNETYVWTLIAGLAAVTVITRSFFLLAGDRLRLPPAVQRALRYAPVCALAGLVAPAIVAPQESLAATLARPEFAGGVAGLAALVGTRSLLLSLAAGMLAFTAMRLA